MNDPENQDIKIALAASADARSEKIREKINICMGLLRKLAASYDKMLDNRGTVSSLVSRLFDYKYSAIMTTLTSLEEDLEEKIGDLKSTSPKEENPRVRY